MKETDGINTTRKIGFFVQSKFLGQSELLHEEIPTLKRK